MTPIRQEFEAWYVENSGMYSSEPIGSRTCHLQWKAWQAATLRQGEKIKVLTDALKKLACLGMCMGNTYGNSDGNCIAIAALAKAKETP